MGSKNKQYSILQEDEDSEEYSPSSNSSPHHGNTFSNSLELPISSSKGKYGQLADRVLFSTAYFILYIVVILSNFALIIWLLVMLGTKKETKGNWAFITLDLFVNLAFVSEISLHILSQRKAYFSKYTNIFDFAVMLLSVLSLGVYFSRNGHRWEQVEDLLALGFLGIRYILQFLRLIAMLRKHRTLHSSRKGVDFSQLKVEDFHFTHADQDSQL